MPACSKPESDHLRTHPASNRAADKQSNRASNTKPHGPAIEHFDHCPLWNAKWNAHKCSNPGSHHAKNNECDQ